MKKVIYYSLMLCFIGCNQKASPESATVEHSEKTEESPKVTGTWQNLSMQVEIESEIDSVVDVPVGEWENVLNIKPIVTTFKEDSTFVSEYRNLGDSVFMTSTGVWWIKDDSLYMEEYGMLNVYHIDLKIDTITFTGYLDWDQDGMADDLYSGVQTRKSSQTPYTNE